MDTKLKWIGLVLLSCGLLVGCEEEDVVFEKQNIVKVEDIVSNNVSKEESPISSALPENVTNGTVSEETYLEIVRFMKEHPQFTSQATSYVKEMASDYTLLKKNSFQKEYKEFLDDYDVFVKGIRLNPSTTADFELSDHMIVIEYSSLDYTEQMRMYLKDGSPYYSENASSALNKRNTSYKALINSMVKYNLFIE